MRGILFGAFEVELDPRTAQMGGSWVDKGKGALRAYDPALLRFFYRRMLEYPGPVVVDAGAGTGSFCLLAAWHPGATCWAFEPNPRAFAALRANVALNGLEERVYPSNCALSEADGRAALKVPSDPRRVGHATLGRLLTAREKGELEVPTQRLDKLGLERLDLLKVDVEGAEAEVLKGGLETIRRCRPEVVFEFNARAAAQCSHKPGDAVGLLWDLGYTRFERVGLEDMWATA